MQYNQIVFFLIALLAGITRFWNIHIPKEVVFDEVHFGKFASYYLQRKYFFDVHPPLGKLLFAFVGWLIGYDGSFLFKNIGDCYNQYKVPYIIYRSLPGLLSTFTVIIVFLIMKEFKFSLPACILSVSILLFDNAHVAITRLIMLDSSLIFFITSSIYCYIKFYKTRREPFSFEWLKWLSLTGVSLSSVISIKYVGVFTFLTIGIIVLIDLWNILDIDSGLTIKQVLKHVVVRLTCLLVLPFLIYLFWFQVHFWVLNKSGPGDPFMSPKFQSTLTANPLTASAYNVYYYEKISLKHKDTNAFLHSHLAFYPQIYEDGRISSAGQQVTGVTFNDTNNIWVVLPQNDEEIQDGNPIPIRFNDKVRFYHIGTDSFLRSHDVASPFYNTNQEFTTIKPEDVGEHYNDTLFQLRPAQDNNGENQEIIKAKAGYMRIIHAPSNVALWTSNDKLLPEWGHNQQEISGNKNAMDETNVWFIDQVFDVDVESRKPKEKKISQIPFLSKWRELQLEMFRANSKLTSDHPYASHPIMWPVTWSGISFWTEKNGRKQIYFHGNPIGWILEVVLLFSYISIYIIDQLCAKRKYQVLSPALRTRLNRTAGFFVLTWSLHYFPFYVMSRQLFLHHYLPAHLCLALFSGAMLDFYSGVMKQQVKAKDKLNGEENKKRKTKKAKFRKSVHDPLNGNKTSWIILLIILPFLISSFIFFSPITYGDTSLTVSEVLERNWLGFALAFGK